MIDPRRWILVEAWLSLGLRVEWMSSWEERDVPPGEWQQDEEEGRYFVYAGDRLWKVKEERRGITVSGPPTVPTFGTATLTHELAHYLAATPDQRRRRNFGIDQGAAGTTDENAAVDTEAVIDAIVGAAARIAGMALQGGRRG